MTARPLVSVMVPTYNQEKYILRAIESVLNQDYENIEILVSDDCSNDRTEEIVIKYIKENQNKNIQYHKNNVNVGILKNYHDTLWRALGDFVVNLDGDDFFIDEQFLSRGVDRLLQNGNLSLVFCNYCEFNQFTSRRLDIVNKNLPDVMSDKDFFARFAEDKILWNHNTILYRRKRALATGCYWHPQVSRNDWESFLRMIVGHSVGYLDFVAAAWVQHGHNETQRPDIKKYINNFVLIDGVAEYAKEVMGESFISGWRNKMILTKTRSSSVGFIKNRDYIGWLKFLILIGNQHPSVVIKVILNPGLMARIILSLNPKVYELAKQHARKLFM